MWDDMLDEQSQVGAIVAQRRFQDVEDLRAQHDDAVRAVRLSADALQQVSEGGIERQAPGAVIHASQRRVREEGMVGKARKPVECHACAPFAAGKRQVLVLLGGVACRARQQRHTAPNQLRAQSAVGKPRAFSARARSRAEKRLRRM